MGGITESGWGWLTSGEAFKQQFIVVLCNIQNRIQLQSFLSKKRRDVVGVVTWRRIAAGLLLL